MYLCAVAGKILFTNITTSMGYMSVSQSVMLMNATSEWSLNIENIESVVRGTIAFDDTKLSEGMVVFRIAMIA